jgi:Ribbon-helix-helix domain
MGIRFQVTLEDTQYRHLTAQSERMSVPVAELIRRAIDKTYALGEDRRTPGVELSLGIWRRPDAAVIGRRAGIRLDR